MRQTATIYLASAMALGALALATNVNCGGDDGERPAGSGGSTGSGGSGTGGSTDGTGGSTRAPGLDCPNAIEPANGASGGVTDFSDWSSSNGRWGDPNGLFGAIYGYKDSDGSTMSASVDSDNRALHAVGSVVSNGYGGIGIGFQVCTKVGNFTKIAFDIMGSSPGCQMDLQIQTFDQRPSDQSPPGGCDPSGSCYGFPTATNAVDLETPISSFTTVEIPLADVTSWSAENAAQVVGLQWQWGGTSVPADPDGGITGCPIDVYVTNVKFLP